MQCVRCEPITTLAPIPRSMPSYKPENVESRSRPLRHSPSRKRSPDPAAAGFFALFSKVMQAGLSTGLCARRPGSGLSRLMFSRPHDYTDLVNRLQASETKWLCGSLLNTSTRVALAEMEHKSNVRHCGRSLRHV